MIKLVETKQQLKKFIQFSSKHYQNDPHYIPPIFYILGKELKSLIFKKKTYKAILAYQDDLIVGRILFTYDMSKHKHEKVCYFSMFEAIDDLNVSKSLFDYIYQDMKNNHVTFLEGTFTPYDPDTRRGILIEGFDSDPSLFTSYNKTYYQTHFEQLGFNKVFDTLLLDGGGINKKNEALLKKLSEYTIASQHIKVEYLNIKKIDHEIDDIYQILNEANNEIIYQEPPTKAMLFQTFKQLKSFINPYFVTIAREIETNRPIGFALILPDYNQLIKKAKGHIFLFPFMKKKSIDQALGKLQYIIPKYQDKGIITSMYYMQIVQLRKHGITSIEMGTMMEDNYKSFHHFSRFGGELKKTYRIYGKDITK